MEKDTEMEARWHRALSGEFLDNFDSNIDVRLHKILGHFAKLFEHRTTLSARNLGPMFGQWGSFLPAELRPPSVLALETASHSVSLETRGQQVGAIFQMNNLSQRPALAPRHGNFGKPNPENVQNRTNPDRDMERSFDSTCVKTSGKRIREDKVVGPFPKKSNTGDYSFSGLHQIQPGFLPSPSHACIKPEARDCGQIKSCILVPNEKRAMGIAPCTPMDNKEQKVQFVTADNILKLEDVQGELKQAIEIRKEAEDLEQRAYRLKKGGEDRLSAELYFEAAIKFLHAAHILEPVNLNEIKPGDADESVKLYVRVGKICEFVAPIFRNWVQVWPAGLAYKCMEVAFMKAGFYKNLGTSNIPPSVCRLLDNVNIMNSAFEGTRGYERALHDAENGNKDISLLKKALNLGCQNMELVLHTVRRALASSPC